MIHNQIILIREYMAKNNTLNSIFTNRIFRIPDYQRGYSWEIDQLKAFWEDAKELNKDKYHYFGMLTLENIGAEKWDDFFNNDNAYSSKLLAKSYSNITKEDVCFNVIDGQQRLTTCIIFINEVINYLNKNNIKEIPEEFSTLKEKITPELLKRRFIMDKEEVGELSFVYKIGNKYDVISNDYLRKIILNNESNANELNLNVYTDNLDVAKRFFENKLAEIKTKEEGFEILDKILNKFVFNVYYVDDSFDVNVAFETMNSRGKRLTNLELLKNRLIYLTTSFDSNIVSDEASKNLRDKINDTRKNIYNNLGKRIPQDGFELRNEDAFLRDHWIIYYTYSRNKGDDYRKDLLENRFSKATITRDNKNENHKNDGYKDIFNYAESLKETSKNWFYSYNPLDDMDGAEEIKSLNRIQISYFRPLVVSTMMLKNASKDKKIELYKTIRRFIFILFRLGKTTSNKYSSFYYSRARELYKCEPYLGNTDDDRITTIINYLESHINQNMTTCIREFKDRIKSNFKGDKCNGYYKWDPIRFVLYEYNKYLGKDATIERAANLKWNGDLKDKLKDKEKLTIEHIFPQRPKNIKKRKYFCDPLTDKERKYLCNSLGNLLPLSKAINSSVSNSDYKTKIDGKGYGRWNGFKDGCYAEKTIANNYKEWSPSSIFNEGINIIKFIEKEFDVSVLSRDENENKELLGINFDFESIRPIQEENAKKFSDDDVDGDYTSYDIIRRNGSVSSIDYFKNRGCENLLSLFNYAIEGLEDFVNFDLHSWGNSRVAIQLLEENNLTKWLGEFKLRKRKGLVCIIYNHDELYTEAKTKEDIDYFLQKFSNLQSGIDF